MMQKLERPWLGHVAIDVLLLTGWLAAVGMVIFHERGGLTQPLDNPMTSLTATLKVKEQWFGIYYQGRSVGFSQLSIFPDERDGVPGVRITDLGRVAFNLLGETQELDVVARAFINADWRLQLFTAEVRSPTYTIKWLGKRQGEELLMTVSTPESSVTKRLHDPASSAFVNGLSSWMAFHRLRLGESGRAWMLNPLSLTPEVVYFTVRKREVIDGQQVLVVESDVNGLVTTTWITSDGEVVKEVSPLGWELRRETHDQAIQHYKDARGGNTPDLLASTSVVLDRSIDHPEQTKRLVLLVKGIGSEGIEVHRPWQLVLPPERLQHYHRDPPKGAWCIVQLDRPNAPTDAAAAATSDAPPERYRQPSLFVQSDDPRVIAKAKEIIGANTDPWQRVMALNHWVFSTVKKQLTVGFPSAVDVLSTPVGDCHEHTVLFTALARSLGLPTRMIAGLVSMQGRMYYHAWPEVWVGRWIPTDPTLGQPVADATHLGLIEAESEQLISLSQYLGKLSVEVLDVEEVAQP